MAGRWAEGFESHATTGQFQRKYAQFAGSFTIKAGRLFGNAGAPIGIAAVTPSLGLDNDWVLGFGAFVASDAAALGASNNGIYLEKGTDEQVHLLMDTDATGFKVKLYRGATLLSETGFDFAFNAWHYFELKINIHPSTGSYELRHNGVQEFTASTVNTADEGTAGADIMAFRYVDNLSAQLRLDDLYLLDGTGSSNNDFLGPRIVEGVLVTANGDDNDWDNDFTATPDVNNFGQVDDAPGTSPDDVGQGGTVSSNTNTDQELYAMADLQTITGNVDFVHAGVQAAMSAAGSRVLRHRFKQGGGGEASGASFTVDSQVFDEFMHVYDINPDTALAWDVGDVDAGQFGMDVVS